MRDICYFPLSLTSEVKFIFDNFRMTIMAEIASFLPQYLSPLVTCFLGRHITMQNKWLYIS